MIDHTWKAFLSGVSRGDPDKLRVLNYIKVCSGEPASKIAEDLGMEVRKVENILARLRIAIRDGGYDTKEVIEVTKGYRGKCYSPGPVLSRIAAKEGL